jgi:hypothetical protein
MQIQQQSMVAAQQQQSQQIAAQSSYAEDTAETQGKIQVKTS